MNHSRASISHVGFTCEEHENPADFFLDTIIRYEKESYQQSRVTVLFSAAAAVAEEEEKEEEESQEVSIEFLTDSSSSKKVKLAETYCKSVQYQDLRKRIDPMLQNMRDENIRETTAKRMQRTFCGQQLYTTTVFWQVGFYPALSVPHMQVTNMHTYILHKVGIQYVTIAAI